MGACIYMVENLQPLLDTVDEQPVGLDVALVADHASAPACTTAYRCSSIRCDTSYLDAFQIVLERIAHGGLATLEGGRGAGCYVYAERYPRGTSRNHSTFVRWAVMV